MTFSESGLNLSGNNLLDKAQHLRYSINRAVQKHPADMLLLSGGIDSSVLAALDPRTPATTVVLENLGNDLRNAQRVTEFLQIPWYPIQISQAEALNNIRELISLTGSYDPAIKNDIPIFAGMHHAASLGFRTIRTGNAADGLFAGYTFLHQPDIDVERWIRNQLPHIRLDSSRIARAMGVRATYPYLDKEVTDAALTFQRDDLIANLDLGKPGDFAQIREAESGNPNTWGKIVLRLAALGLLPNEIIWRTKTDLEFGSGMDLLEGIIENAITPEEIKEMRASGKTFWNKYHGKLYLMYRDLGLEHEQPQSGEYPCRWCGAGVVENRRHCETCGGFPVNRLVHSTFVKKYSENQYRKRI